MTSARWLITSQLTSIPPPLASAKRITRQRTGAACPPCDTTNTLLNPPLINHTHTDDTFSRRAIARIDVIIADSLFTTVATTPFFSRARRTTLNFASPSFHRRVNYQSPYPFSTPLSSLYLFFFFVYLTAINKCQRSDCRRGRLRNEMWNENAGNEWRPKLGYAKLRLKLKEHARESIIFRESWPGERFQSLALKKKRKRKKYDRSANIVEAKNFAFFDFLLV